jgi:hypothetical protein
MSSIALLEFLVLEFRTCLMGRVTRGCVVLVYDFPNR